MLEIVVKVAVRYNVHFSIFFVLYKKFEFVGYVFLILQYVCFQYKTDASNVYDEEVFDAKEMYFSDDEEERQFKQRSKRKGGNKSEDSVKSGKSNFIINAPSTTIIIHIDNPNLNNLQDTILVIHNIRSHHLHLKC